MGSHRFPRVLALGAALIALLIATAAPAALAAKAPGLASSTQYKAFIEYVKKLDSMSTQPTSTEQKNTYEAKLTAKKTATAHKANALFNRASEEAQAEANEEAKEQVVRVKAKEEEALEGLHVETGTKLERAEGSFNVKYEHIVTGHRNREKAIKGQIAELRTKKAKAKSPEQKTQIQELISKKGEEVAANRQDEKTKRTELKSAYLKQKGVIQEAAKAAEVEFAAAAEATIQKINQHWNKQYLAKKSALNETRESRLEYLETKLEQGRAAIAAMPTT
jgi:hypothetical protein